MQGGKTNRGYQALHEITDEKMERFPAFHEYLPGEGTYVRISPENVDYAIDAEDSVKLIRGQNGGASAGFQVSMHLP